MLPSLLALTLFIGSGFSFLTGINLAGLEFGSNIPGTVNVDYGAPTNAEIDYFMGKGMNVFRLPFLWERLQPSFNGSFNGVYQSYITNFVTYATGKGAKVIVDPHNYARYGFDSSCIISYLVILLSCSGLTARYNNGIIGQDVPMPSFVYLWAQLANLFKNNNNVIFGLMNEPNSMSSLLASVHC
jgi:endoglucanase